MYRKGIKIDIRYITTSCISKLKVKITREIDKNTCWARDTYDDGNNTFYHSYRPECYPSIIYDTTVSVPNCDIGILVY